MVYIGLSMVIYFAFSTDIEGCRLDLGNLLDLLEAHRLDATLEGFMTWHNHGCQRAGARTTLKHGILRVAKQ